MNSRFCSSCWDALAPHDLGDTDPERAAIARHWLAESGTVKQSGVWVKVALNEAAMF